MLSVHGFQGLSRPKLVYAFLTVDFKILIVQTNNLLMSYGSGLNFSNMLCPDLVQKLLHSVVILLREDVIE